MKRVFQTITVFLFLVMVMGGSGCYYDKEEKLYAGAVVCDTTAAPTYAATVVPILSNNCYVCHGGAATAGSGIQLDTYNGLKVKVNDGKLLQAINHESGASPMPKNGAKLSACNIAKIRRWVNAGALNN
jgi:mono/diheme cytochrome c family protein